MNQINLDAMNDGPYNEDSLYREATHDQFRLLKFIMLPNIREHKTHSLSSMKKHKDAMATYSELGENRSCSQEWYDRSETRQE